ncbi:MAG: 50S ribosomal protein L17 [Micropruina sp.]|nr:50S ribosomal protein L17 [Micropruina sp.]
MQCPSQQGAPRFGGSPAHQRIILANLASQLFEHGRITTTEARPVASAVGRALISKAKRGDLHNRRIVLATITDKGVVHTLFTEIAPTFAGREGGLHPDHQGRAAQGRQRPMAVIEIVAESVEESRKHKAKGKAGTASASPKQAPPKKAAKPSEPTNAELPAEEADAIEPTNAELPAQAVAEVAEDADTLPRAAEPPAGLRSRATRLDEIPRLPESPWYAATIAEVWFKTEEAAQKTASSTR